MNQRPKNEGDKSEKRPFPKKPLWFRMSHYTMGFILALVIIVLLIGMVGVGAAAGLVASLVKDQDVPTKEELAQDIQTFSQTSYIYDKNGDLIGTGELRTANDRDLVSLDEISPYIVDAFISTEDKEFHDHIGIVPRSLVRAAYQDLSGSTVTTGGSTITQQLVKLSVLRNPDQTYTRKAREIFLAMRLDRLFEKDEILHSYLNRIYFGKGASGEHLYGIEAAAEGIFGVNATEVNLAQAAYLAGIPQLPGAYSPFNEETLKAGLERQNTVLRRMLENEKITQEQFDQAKSFNIAEALTEPKPSVYEQYKYLFEAIHKRAAETLMREEGINVDELKGDTKEKMYAEYRTRVAEGGYHIHTTIDLKLYDALNKFVREYDGYKKDVEVTVEGIEGKITAKEQLGSALVDVETGALLAFVGGRDKEDVMNRALDTRKQPGSAAKPLFAYGPGMANGTLQPGSILDDSPKTAKVSANHTVSNYANNFHGFVTAREALKESYNVAATDAFLNKVGIEAGYDFLEKMGYTFPEKFHVPSAVLGTNGFSPAQMAGAFATFANQGKFNEVHLISTIEDSDGQTVFEHEVKPKEVMSPQSAYLLTDVLRDVLTSGTGVRIGNSISNAYDLAGKTGTTQDHKDSWFVGYTPKIALSLWIGYDYEKSKPTVRPNRNLSKIMWAQLFNKILETRPDLSPSGAKFKRPDGITSASICRVSGKKPTEHCKAAGSVYTEFFESGHTPGEKCDVHIEARAVKYDGDTYIANDQTPDDMVLDKGVGMRIPDHHKGLNLPYSTKNEIPWEKDPRESEGEPKAPEVKVSDGTVTWAHTGQASVVGYRVYQSTDGKNFKRVASIRLDEENVYNGQSGVEYIVRAVDVVGLESGNSNVGGNLKPDAPSQPQGLKGSYSSGKVTLNWNANPDEQQIQHYVVLLNSGDGFKQVGKTDKTSFTHQERFEGSRSYRIAAVNDGGQSAPSNTAKVKGEQPKSQDPKPDKSDDEDDDSGQGSDGEKDDSGSDDNNEQNNKQQQSA